MPTPVAVLLVSLLIAGLSILLFALVLSVCFDGSPDLLMFWQRGWRLEWKYFLLARRVRRIRGMQRRDEYIRELHRKIESEQRDLAELAYKEPHKFLKT